MYGLGCPHSPEASKRAAPGDTARELSAACLGMDMSCRGFYNELIPWGNNRNPAWIKDDVC